MKFELPEHDRSEWSKTLWWWFIKAISAHAKSQGYEYAFKVPGWEDMNNSNTDVEFKINGVELDFNLVLKRFEEAYKWNVQQSTKKLFRDKMRDIIYEACEPISDFAGDIKSILKKKEKELADKLGIEDYEDDYY